MPTNTLAVTATSTSARLSPELIKSITKAISAKYYYRDDCGDLINQAVMQYLEFGDITLTDQQIVYFCTNYIGGHVSNLREKTRLWNGEVRNPAEDKDKSRGEHNDLNVIPELYRRGYEIEEIAAEQASPEDVAIHRNKWRYPELIFSTATKDHNR